MGPNFNLTIRSNDSITLNDFGAFLVQQFEPLLGDLKEVMFLNYTDSTFNIEPCDSKKLYSLEEAAKRQRAEGIFLYFETSNSGGSRSSLLFNLSSQTIKKSTISITSNAMKNINKELLMKNSSIIAEKIRVNDGAYIIAFGEELSQEENSASWRDAATAILADSRPDWILVDQAVFSEIQKTLSSLGYQEAYSDNCVLLSKVRWV